MGHHLVNFDHLLTSAPHEKLIKISNDRRARVLLDFHFDEFDEENSENSVNIFTSRNRTRGLDIFQVHNRQSDFIFLL